VAELRDHDPDLRYWAAEGITVIIARAPRETQVAAIQPLLDVAVRDTSPAARSTAVRAFWQLGAVGCPAMPTLLTLASDPDPGMRWRVAAAFGDIGLECLPNRIAAQVLAVLRADVADSDDMVRLYAVQSLGELGAAGTAGLSAALAGSDSLAAGDAAGSLGQLPPTADVVEPLLRALSAPAANVRLNAAYALGGFGPPVREQLMRAAQSRSGPVRDAARKGIEFYEHAARSHVANRCYAVAIGTWMPDLALGADTIFLRAPPLVRFTTVKYDHYVILDTLPPYQVQPASLTPRSPGWIGYWEPVGDSVRVGWSNGFSGFGATFGATADTLRGTAISHWDFNREPQMAAITFAAAPCP
ncbi:MAG TPA: HEAT repeat domain-containing protein, partial [Gemmatimonadales bacterium]|nr:HEAT repeat domain-containing protein [Gemmatimonadales bacterium]